MIPVFRTSDWILHVVLITKLMPHIFRSFFSFQSAPVNSTKNMQRFFVELGKGSNLGSPLTTNRVCPEETVKLSALAELPVVELRQ